MHLIKKMLSNGCIEDSNEVYNRAFEQIISDDGVEENDIEFKDYLTSKFTERVYKGDSLLQRYLLVPMEELVSNERWGWSREGTNAMSSPLSTFADDLPNQIAAFKETYKEIKNFTFVFMIKQYAG